MAEKISLKYWRETKMEWSEKNARKAFNDDVGLPGKKVFIFEIKVRDIFRLSET